jgi:hypothetical protein
VNKVDYTIPRTPSAAIRPNRRAFLRWLGLAIAAHTAPALAACAPAAPPALTATGLGELAGIHFTTRAQWGAAAPDLNAAAEHGLYDQRTNPEGWRVYDQPLAGLLNTVVIHHSALPLSDGPREIKTKHMHNKGYADIGYHFVIDAPGQIYEGRSLLVRGAHTGGHNTGTVGVCLLGNFEDAAPPAAQAASAQALARALKVQYGLTHLARHRDFQPDETVCPGKYLEPQLPAWAQAVGLQFGIGGYVPPA